MATGHHNLSLPSKLWPGLYKSQRRLLSLRLPGSRGHAPGLPPSSRSDTGSLSRWWEMLLHLTSCQAWPLTVSAAVCACTRVCLCAPTRVFAVRVIFDCVCLRWGRCSFSCSFHDHYITCGIFAATGVYFHPCESWSKLLFKHRLETEIFSDAQTASPIKMIELPLINNSYWKHGIMWQRCHFIRKKMNTGERITGLWPKIPNTTFCLVCFFTALSCFVHSLCRDTTEEEASYVRFHKDNV